jgi:hypothetical protein
LKYAVEIGSGAMIYIPSFVRHSKVDENTQTHRQHGDLISPVFFSKGNKLKTCGRVVCCCLV